MGGGGESCHGAGREHPEEEKPVRGAEQETI
jgi:hypothetical protein